MADVFYDPKVFGSLTVADTAIGFPDADILSGDKEAKMVTISSEDAASRFRIDGGDPTTTVGHLLNSDVYIEIEGINAVRKFRAIRTTATSAKLKYTLYF